MPELDELDELEERPAEELLDARPLLEEDRGGGDEARGALRDEPELTRGAELEGLDE